jgi:O-methyltransferase
MIPEQLWSTVAEHSLLGRRNSEFLCDLLRGVLEKRLDGNVAECGVYRGATATLIAFALKKMAPEKKLFMFDSFEGLPATDPARDTMYYHASSMSGEGVELYSFVMSLLRQAELEDLAIIRKGWFEETLPALDTRDRFCFIHIDCDIYSSTKTCLEHLYDRLVPNGVVVIDDYFDIGGGLQLAVDEFVRNTGETLFVGPGRQVYFEKGRQLDTAERRFLLPPFDGNSVPVSIVHVVEDVEYLERVQHSDGMVALSLPWLRRAATWTDCDSLVSKRVKELLSYHEKVLAIAKDLAATERLAKESENNRQGQ